MGKQADPSKKVTQLHAPKKHQLTHLTAFQKSELSAILNIYSFHVAAGHWKDYGISTDTHMAQFSIFHNAHDIPVFTIAKIGKHHKMRPKGRYVVMHGVHPLVRTHDLDIALAHLKRASNKLYAPAKNDTTF
jgi:predicted acetyltransferase